MVVNKRVIYVHVYRTSISGGHIICVYALQLVATTQVVTHFKHSYDYSYIAIIMVSYLAHRLGVHVERLCRLIA
jgi:hypothetical protein